MNKLIGYLLLFPYRRDLRGTAPRLDLWIKYWGWRRSPTIPIYPWSLGSYSRRPGGAALAAGRLR